MTFGTVSTESILGFFKVLLSILSVFSVVIIYMNFKVDIPQHANNEALKPVTYLQSLSDVLEPNTKENEVPKVLILTQARSGSSFLGSLMSAGSGAYYLFEPYKNMRFKGNRLDDMLDKEDPEAIELAKNIFLGIFDCKTYNHTTKRRSRGKVKRCDIAKSIVVKSIRLRYSSVQTWINDTDVKVIHLVRDPRAILNSRENGGWRRKLQAEDYVCSNLSKDLNISQLLPPHRYRLVRYEDVAADPVNVTKKLYEFSGIPFTQEIENHVKKITHGSQNKKSFFGVVRSSDFDINHWRSQMTIEKIRSIENACQSFMKLMDYAVVE